MMRPAWATPPEPLPGSPRAGAGGWITGVDHYENFPVGSLLVPRTLRPAVVAIYRFARYADDVADEGDAPAEQRLAELERLRRALGGAGPLLQTQTRAEPQIGSAGAAPSGSYNDLGPQDDLGIQTHPVVDALREHIRTHRLSVANFLALLCAFEQDVTVSRYPDREALLEYCRHSADPIGRLMLQLFGAFGPRSAPLSDAICTALQLINFLQDFALDWSRGRLYLPMDELRAAGLDESRIDAAVRDGRAPPELRALIETQARHCARLLDTGTPLVRQVPARLAWELRAIIAGGRRILEQLRRDGFDPIARRPKLGWRDAPALIRLTLIRPAAR
jgi:phytoene synthase